MPANKVETLAKLLNRLDRAEQRHIQVANENTTSNPRLAIQQAYWAEGLDEAQRFVRDALNEAEAENEAR